VRKELVHRRDALVATLKQEARAADEKRKAVTGEGASGVTEVSVK